jgi:hypothetical protein
MSYAQTADRAFVVLFARARRKLAAEPIDVVWQRACFASYELLVAPSAAVAGIAMAIIKVAGGFDKPLNETITTAFITAVCAVVWWTTTKMDRRFRKFLHSPPAVAVVESNEDRIFMLKIRVLGVFSFGAVIIIAVALNELGRAHI